MPPSLHICLWFWVFDLYSIIVWINAFKAKIASHLMQKTNSMKWNTKIKKEVSCCSWSYKLVLISGPVFLHVEKVRASWIRSHLRDYCYCLVTIFSSLKSTECFLSGYPVFYLPSKLCWLIWQYLHFIVAQFYTHYRDYIYLSMLSKHIVHEIEIWEISPGNV